MNRPLYTLKEVLSMETRNGLFAQVPAEDWNDWHWQVAHRVETLEDLKKYIILQNNGDFHRTGNDWCSLKDLLFEFIFQILTFFSI